MTSRAKATVTSLRARGPHARAILLRDSRAAARDRALFHVSGIEPGIVRVRQGKGFVYRSPSGKRVTSAADLRRIASLAIPPAWERVWIATRANAHLQCTGYDVRGRKQYRYHAKFREVRDEAKFHDVCHFAAELPRLRRAMKTDVESSALTKDKVIATILGIMERTSIRVGNDRYAAENGSYGLTTLRDGHAKIAGSVVQFSFRGKGGKAYRAAIRDRKLAAIVKRCRDIPGQRLFQYEDAAGRYRAVTSTDVNQYIQRNTGKPFTAKEFRTWAATVQAAMILHAAPACRTLTERRRTMLASIDEVAAHLGNTRAICRKSYVHPAILEAYEADRLLPALARCFAAARARTGLAREECAVLALLETLGRDPETRAAA